MIRNSTLEAIGNTPLIRLRQASEITGCNILGKAEFANPGQSVKDRAGLFIIEDAVKRKQIEKGGIIVEGTAGNTGIGLTVVANALGFKTVIVIPKTQSQEKKDALRLMGAELVEGGDLVVEDDCVYMRTINGLSRVDVIYRRIDDMFLDPEVFHPDSVLGVKGLMRAWLKGNVALANAPGAGVADDKVIYTYVPAMIKYYLAEEPLLENVPSYLCVDEKQCQYVLENLDKLVVKPANESGGYGMLMGPQASKKERDEFARRIRANPRNYMAQPLISLSTAPVLGERGAEPRHIDLRPFILQAKDTYVTPGGLTRVAMVKGSYVVNSSQGGGSKDTWIVSEEER